MRLRILLLAMLVGAALPTAAAITGRFVTYERTRLSVVQSGVEAGRTVVDPSGARVHLGVAADARAFENHFLAMLGLRASDQMAIQE